MHVSDIQISLLDKDVAAMSLKTNKYTSRKGRVRKRVSRKTADKHVESTEPPLEFPDGAVRITHLEDESQSDNTMITFEELVQPKKLRQAVLSAFLVDIDWLEGKFEKETKIVLVENYNPKAEQQETEHIYDGMWEIVHPEFHPQQLYPVMHSKLMVLFYEKHVRVVVSSANLIPVDWSIIQNILFIQDLPYTRSRPNPINAFGKSLREALLDLGTPRPAIYQLRFVDFSKATAHLVTSIPTKYARRRSHTTHYGLARIAQVAHIMKSGHCMTRQEQADYEGSLNVYAYGTSMSRITEQYLAAFYVCAQGADPKSLRGTTKWSKPKHLVNMHIGFLTESQAQAFKHEEGRNCMRFQPNMYYNRQYPRTRLSKVQTTFDGVATHAKVVMARLGEKQDRGWLYLGSHNFTQGAWGRPVGTPRPEINNYELGIILPDVRYVVEAGVTHAVWNGSRIPLSIGVDWQPYGDRDIPCLYYGT